MKKQFSIVSAKIAKKASKLLGKGGSATPGQVARKIDSRILAKVRENSDTVIFISGTNGKTTTSQVLASILIEEAGTIVHNIEGSNMITGITTAFVTSQNMAGTKKYKYAVIEIDEGSIHRVFKEIAPDYFLFTNFFRDQLDRFGEIDMLVEKIKKDLDKKDIKLLLNADDPYVKRLSNGKRTQYFGMNSDAHSFGKQTTMESTYCPLCGDKLQYTHVHYGQLGHYKCGGCSFKRPMEKYTVQKLMMEPKGLKMKMNSHWVETNIHGDYNVSNIAAAVSMALNIGISWETIKKAIANLKIENGRMEYIKVGNKDVLLNLAKNPAGLNVSFENIKNFEGEKNVLILLNDRGVDGKDISWIWDADFESLVNMDIKEYHCSGTRAEELALRFKYAGADESKIFVEKDYKKAIEKSLIETEYLFVIPNYSPLETTRQELIEIAKKGSGK